MFLWPCLFFICFSWHPQLPQLCWQSSKCKSSYTESSCHLGRATAVLDKKKSLPLARTTRTPWAEFSDSDMDRVCCNMDMLGMFPSTAAGCLPCWWSEKCVWNYPSASGVPREDREWWELRCALAVPLGGDGHMVWERGRFHGGHNRCLIAHLSPKALCQPAPVRWC